MNKVEDGLGKEVRRCGGKAMDLIAKLRGANVVMEIAEEEEFSLAAGRIVDAVVTGPDKSHGQ